MEPGDLVRFHENYTHVEHSHNRGPWKYKIGLLVEYNKWEKVARILYDGEIISKHASSVSLHQRSPESLARIKERIKRKNV